jgi:hypothetical protein
MNRYEALAERQISAPRKVRQPAIEKRARARVGEALAEHDQQFALWRKWRHERSEALLAGPYANAARDLLDLLDRLTFEGGGRLAAQVRAGPWAAADADTRFLILAAIDNALAGVRERNGLPPFDDNLPWSDEPLSGDQGAPARARLPPRRRRRRVGHLVASARASSIR